MSSSATNLRARLSRDELHQLRWLLGLGLVLLAYWTLFGLEVGSYTAAIFITAVVFSALVFPTWPGWLPRWVRWAILPVGAMYVLYELMTSRFDLLSALVLMVSLLTLYRALQYRRRREDWQLILLCLFIIVLSGVLTLSILFGLQILLFAVVTMALLFVMNLLDRDAGRALTSADWRHFHWPRYLRRLRDALDLRQLFLAGGLFAALVVLSTIIFVAMPRYRIEQAFSFPRLKGVSGFQENIEYKESKELTSDDTIALRVDVPPGVDFRNKADLPYWRMIVFDKYENNAFRTSNVLLPSTYEKSARYMPGKTRQTAGGERTLGKWKYYLEGNVSEYLPILGTFNALTFSSPQAFHPEESVHIYRTDQASPNVIGYEIEDMDMGNTIPAADIDLKAPISRTEVDTEVAKDIAAKKKRISIVYPRTYLGLPTNPEDRAFLDKMVSDIRAGRDDMPLDEFAKRATSILQSQHPASTSVNLPKVPEGRDILVEWMQTKQSSGWCEHFAGSFTLLMRAAGYPTRIAAGYRGATYNSIENYYFVRQSDAHAWAEVFDGRDRWVRYDPTPGGDTSLAGLLGGLTSSVKTEEGWSARMDSLRMLWYRRVINFDQTDQQEFADKVGQYGSELATGIRQWFAALGDNLYNAIIVPLSPWRLEVFGFFALLLAFALRFRLRLHNWWLRASGRGLLGRLSHLAPVRRDAGRWLVRFLPVWQAVAPKLPLTERAVWEQARLDLLALRYGPLETLPDPAQAFQRTRRLLKTRPLRV